ncbi:DNA polymerase [Aurantimonas sp. A2-1-M11]|uniref:DNA polymerase n=1 Tax=Aurantimonas sp. A2-1-M11 TaxID=3113712 RepID=UPI002F9593F8
MTALHIDFESRSTVDLKKTGAFVYAADPTTDLWCACYAFDDGDVLTWRPGEPCPDDIAMHVIEGGELHAHNAAFEAILWERILGPRYGWPVPDPTQWRCTMVQAYALALPGSLEQAAPAAGLDIEKDSAGRRLMLQMAKPRKTDPLTWWDAPEKVERLISYCRIDVEVERELGKRLRPLKPSELDLWHLDQRINGRGVYVDRKLANAAKRIVKTAAERLDKRMAAVTNFAVSACSNRNQLIAWVRERGLDGIESIAKDQIEELLARDDLPTDVREALEIRRQSARASVAKIDALLNGTDADGRARGLLQFHAASTGRWAGRRFQPQNIKRPDLEDVDSAIDIIGTGDIDLVDMLYEDPLNVVADCLRGMIRAAPGRKIVAADYANIEGRVLAWLAGERWKVQAFRDFDAGEGPDLYKVAYGRSYGIAPADVTKAQRQIGKVMELALGYQGGVGAFATMGVNYGVRLPVPEVEAIRDAWRAAHPAIKQFWRDMEDAAIEATQTPGRVGKVGAVIAFKRVGSWLFMQLPSKRFLAYAYPEIRTKEMPWTNDDGSPVYKDQLSYMGVNSYTRKWERGFAYGGLLAENATQAVARDVMADAMPRLEAAGYPLILSVHDELVTEPKADHGSAAEMEAILCDLPEWAAGLPVAAEGFEAERYRK